MSDAAQIRDTAVVTGGAGDIGAAVIRQLLSDGYQVVSIDIHASDVQGAYSITANLADSRECDEAFSRSVRHLGEIHCLVNCTGLLSSSALVDTGPDEVTRVLDATLVAPINAVRSVLSGLDDSAAARVILNVGSVWALGGGASRTVYAAAKHGLLGLSRSLAAELRGKSVTVVTLSPGPVRTRMLERPGVRDLYVEEDLLEPTEVAQLISWILHAPRGLLHGANIVCGRSQPPLFVN